MLRGPFTVPRVAPSGEFPSGGGDRGARGIYRKPPSYILQSGRRHVRDLMGQTDNPRALQMPRSKSYGTSALRLRQIAQVQFPKIAFLWLRDLPEGRITHTDAIILQYSIVPHISRIVKGFFEIFCVFFGLIKIDKNEPAPRRRPSPPFRGASGGLPPRSFLLFYAYFQKIRETLFTNS